MNVVKLVSSTIVDWTGLICTTQQLFGQSVTRQLDLNKVDLSSPFAYTLAIEILANVNWKINKVNRGLDFTHLTFLIALDDEEAFDTLLRASNLCSLKVDAKKFKCGLICGTVRQFKDVIEVCCKEDQLYEVRLAGNKMYLTLESAGFKELFKSKKSLPDSTFEV